MNETIEFFDNIAFFFFFYTFAGEILLENHCIHEIIIHKNLIHINNRNVFDCDIYMSSRNCIPVFVRVATFSSYYGLKVLFGSPEPKI